ncbi:hypothetical protein GQ53DRAFT_742634 [Thozetella sp. PMI_491]|nr:hypothetical protein GQ53DRAFT_742634 [Thozetella sp. PMI_491]
MDNATHFEYQPLQGSEIRLITIKPGVCGSLLECCLEHLPLEDEGLEYVALSYVWGDESNKVSIRLNNTSFNITRNLFHAFCQIRKWATGDSDVLQSHFSPRKKYLFWADAICLNQDDREEKIKQIPRMEEIYGRAVLVLGWLGRSDKRSQNTVSKIFQMGRDLAKNPFMKGSDFASYPWVLQAVGGELSGFLEAFTKIISLPWFSRVWILQEAVLPRKPPLLVLGGNYSPSVGLANLQSSLIHGRTAANFDQDSTADYKLRAKYGLMTIHILRHLNRNRIATPSHTAAETHLQSFASRLLQVLSHKTPEYQSTLDHDTLYGVLGIARGSTLPDILAPNYDKPYSSVCEEYAKFLMENTGYLTILSGDGERFDDTYPNIPSWVPDFRFLSQPFADPQTKGDISFSLNGKILAVDGVSLGRCTHVLMPTSSDSKIIDPFVRLEQEILRPASILRNCDFDSLLDEWLESWIKAPYNLSVATLRKHYDTVVRKKPLVVQSFEDVLEFESQKGQVCNLMDGIENYIEHGYVVLSENGSIGIMVNCTKQPGVNDLLCVLKGSTTASVVRSLTEGCMFLGSCALLCSLSKEVFDDSFFSCREMQKFLLL